MQHNRLRARFEALAWVALVVFIGYRIWPQVAAAVGVDTASTAAPAFQLTTLDGRPVSSEQLRGRVVLVNFWATWCPPCRFEMPGFQAVFDRKRDSGFVVLGISTDAAGPQVVERYLAEHRISYPVAMGRVKPLHSSEGYSRRFSNHQQQRGAQ